MKQTESVIIINNSKGQKVKQVTAKGRGSRRSKVHKLQKVERFDAMHTNELQRRLDLDKRISEGKANTKAMNKAKEDRRAMFKANRKAKHNTTV